MAGNDEPMDFDEYKIYRNENNPQGPKPGLCIIFHQDKYRREVSFLYFKICWQLPCYFP